MLAPWEEHEGNRAQDKGSPEGSAAGAHLYIGLSAHLFWFPFGLVGVISSAFPCLFRGLFGKMPKQTITRQYHGNNLNGTRVKRDQNKTKLRCN
jgi:hypothetical protein